MDTIILGLLIMKGRTIYEIRERMENIKKSIPLRHQKGEGHCVNMDVPEEFNEVMESFYR